jgi:hypothetical protein
MLVKIGLRYWLMIEKDAGTAVQHRGRAARKQEQAVGRAEGEGADL